jgi:hypothetical protein
MAEFQRFAAEMAKLQTIRKKHQCFLDQDNMVSVITPTSKQIYMKNIFENYRNQNYKNKELIIILNNDKLNLRQWRDFSNGYKNIHIFRLNETVSLGECLNFAIDQSAGEFIARFDDDDYYGMNYLTDMLTYFIFTKASVIGKTCNFIYFEALKRLCIERIDHMDFNSIETEYNPWHRYFKVLTGATQVIKREVFNTIRYQNLDSNEDRLFCKECQRKGIKQYAADPFNYTIVRHPDKNFHTWKIGDNDLLQYCLFVCETDDFKSFVTV